MNNIFEQYDFSISNYLGRGNSVDRLYKIDEYLNFALKATVLRQNPALSLENQKACSKQLLLNYLKGDAQSFTRLSAIRTNVQQISKINIIDSLIKNSIEKDCYNRNIVHSLDENLCSRITNEIYIGKYEEIISMIFNNDELLIPMINDYIEFKYNKDNVVTERLDKMCSSDVLTSNALNQLNLSMKLYEQKNISRTQK